MSKKLFLFSFILILTSCIETVAIATFGTGYLISREKTVKETVLDSAILAQASKILLNNNKDQKFSKINMSVYDGRVLLVGYSESREYIQEAIKLIWKINNVSEVINEVSFDTEDKNQSQFLDFALLSSVKLQLIWSKELKAKDVNISIYNGKTLVRCFYPEQLYHTCFN